MSADNGYVVTPLYRQPGKFGIFYYSGDGDYPREYYTVDNTVDKIEYRSAIKAIMRGHSINRNSNTEYGVYVHSMTLNYALEEIS